MMLEHVLVLIRFRFPCFQENKAIQLLESRNESYSPFDDVRMLPFWTETFPLSAEAQAEVIYFL